MEMRGFFAFSSQKYHHDCNTSYSGGGSKKMEVQDQLGQESVRLYHKSKPGMMAHTCGPSYSGGNDRRISLRPTWTKVSSRPYLRNKPKQKY
jgi:hypothetical protein